MRVVTFDIETANWLQEGSGNLLDLDIAIVGVHDSETGKYSSYLESELPQLWKILEYTDVLVGYNSDHFDVPLLNKYYPGNLSAIKSLDILKEIHKSTGRRLKLDSIAEATLGTKKIGNGLQSLKWWRDGEVEKVREYCLKDVEITRRIYDYALKHSKLLYKELGKSREIQLDTKDWLEKKGGAMTFTLGF